MEKFCSTSRACDSKQSQMFIIVQIKNCTKYCISFLLKYCFICCVVENRFYCQPFIMNLTTFEFFDRVRKSFLCKLYQQMRSYTVINNNF